MKKNCNNCAALCENFGCNLGFKNEKAYKEISVLNSKESIRFWKPLEECPKPKSYSEYVRLYLKEKQ